MGSVDITDLACLQPKHFFGLNSQIKGNVHYITEDEILYPNGTVLVLHNFTGKRQKYIRLNDRARNITNICVSPNKRLIAVGEKGDPATISLYDSLSLKRKRILSTPFDRALSSRTIECMAFTFDSKHLLAVYGEPDWMLICFKSDRGKVESMTRANNISNTGTVRQIACNPNDTGVVVLVGDILFRMLVLTENSWRQYGYSKAEGFPLRCATWLTQERIIAGTADGKIMVVENGELRLVIKVDECSHINFQQRDEMSQSSMTALLATMGTNLDNSNEINLIQAFPKGFLFDYGPGKMILFEKETGLKYKKRNVFRLDEQKPDSMIIEEATTQVVEEENLTKINSFSISPTQDYLVVTCALPQLFFVYMWGPDINRQAEIKFNELGPSVHRGAITGISVCAWKPILMTVSQEDRSVRIWNYETQDLLVSRNYQDDLYGIDLHPTGLYALVGFSNKLRFMTLLIDDFTIIKEFPLRYCSVVRFSNQGHLFAAVNGNLIQIYSSVTFDNTKNLKGHNAMITDLRWITNDNILISCGTEGALYEWDLVTGKRVQELIIKTCSFTGAAITSDGKISYCVGSEGNVKEVINGAFRMVNQINKQGLDCMVLSKIDTMLFVSGTQGMIYSMKIPLTDKDSDRMGFMVNNEKIVQMVMSYDDKYLISCARDGLCIWKLTNVLNKGIKIDKDFSPFADILIPYEDLEQKLQMIKDLNLRLTELDREHSYQIRQILQSHTNKLVEVHEAYKEAIENLKEKNSTLETEHTQEIHNINMEIAKTKRTHDVALDHLEATYNEKLIVEYNKFSNLEEKLLKIRQDYERQIVEYNSDAKNNKNKIREQFMQKLKDKDVILEELQEDIQQQLQSHEIIKQQIEDDADREIYELKTAHEAALIEEQSVNIKLRAENGMFRKNLTATQKESEEWKTIIFNLENEHAKYRNMINTLEKDVSELRKELIDRDETIQEKEKRIYDLKKRSQELEKYKYVLDFKITELKAEIEPRERRIHDQKDQIHEMVKELENLQKNIISLELLIKDLKEKLEASQLDYKREQIKLRQTYGVIKSMRTDLHQASGMIHDTGRLKIAVREMFHKYNADKDFVITREEDCESKNEFLKQRHYLEKNITRLKKTVSKRFNRDQDKITMMEESNELITEVNILRHQLKLEQNRNAQMESILGFKHKNMQPREAQKLLANAVKTSNDIRREYAEEIEVQNVRINLLKEENVRLTKKIL